jgi:hypothetical protein
MTLNIGLFGIVRQGQNFVEMIKRTIAIHTESASQNIVEIGGGVQNSCYLFETAGILKLATQRRMTNL